MVRLGLDSNGFWFLSVEKDFNPYCKNCQKNINYNDNFFYCRFNQIFFCVECGKKNINTAECDYLLLGYGEHEHNLIKSVKLGVESGKGH